MKKRFRTACFGGTFDIPLHKGHAVLIRKAFDVAEFCYIGVATNDYVWRKGKRGVRAFGERRTSLVKFLTSIRVGKNRYKITNLDNFFGPEAIDPKRGIEAIVVSEETLTGARGINLIREDYGLKPLEVIEVAMVKARDYRPISSTRIRAKEIDRDGKSLKN